MSGQYLSQDEIDRIVGMYNSNGPQRNGFCERQVWGVPWTEMDFAKQMLRFGHPAILESCLPQVLKDVVHGYSSMEERERMSLRASSLAIG